jgi:hypothetical protein
VDCPIEHVRHSGVLAVVILNHESLPFFAKRLA